MADSVVVQSKVKEAVKGLELRMDGNLPDALNDKVHAILKTRPSAPRRTVARPCVPTTSDRTHVLDDGPPAPVAGGPPRPVRSSRRCVTSRTRRRGGRCHPRG